MNQNPVNPPPSGISLGDIYYVLFRHKWKILIISALGIAIALVMPLLVQRPYQSIAKIWVRYVVDSKSPGQIGAGNSSVRSTDDRGGGIISSEIQILTSLDIAQQVADIIGPEKILAKVDGGKDRQVAAAFINGHLKVEVPGGSSVIEITFQHPDLTLVQPVLNELVESYFKRHAEIHHPVVDDFLNRETDRLRLRLAQTENALRSAKTNAGIISLDDAKKTYMDQLSRIQADIFSAQAELGQRQATLSEITKLASSQPIAATNVVSTNAMPPEKLVEYKRLSSQVEDLVKRQQELSVQFTDEYPLVKSLHEQIATLEKTKSDLEKQFPELLAVASESKLSNLSSSTKVDIIAERTGMAAIAAKINVLTNQLAQLRLEASSLDAVEGTITDLQRKKELEESSYKYFSANLEQSLIDDAIGADKISNISKIQTPSPPFRDSKKLNKMMAVAAFGGVAIALALAFFIELFMDRSIRRSIQITSQFRAPLFLSIPRLKLNGISRDLKPARKTPLLQDAQPLENKTTADPNVEADNEVIQAAPRNGHIAPWDIRHALRPFFETLRDRLIVFFEVNNLTHKPKLVAVTSCGEGAGVTTTAAGLAACLSETGEGNVLLVDMNVQQGEAHHFYKGQLDCGLDDALEGDKRDNALVQENLYVVAESTKHDKLPQILPKRFKHLIPRLRASDYDYIIFDMPPVTQISPTPRLAQFMDMIFLVVESEKTDRDVVKNAAELLGKSQVNVGVILNKTKSYIPGAYNRRYKRTALIYCLFQLGENTDLRGTIVQNRLPKVSFVFICRLIQFFRTGFSFAHLLSTVNPQGIRFHAS